MRRYCSLDDRTKLCCSVFNFLVQKQGRAVRVSEVLRVAGTTIEGLGPFSLHNSTSLCIVEINRINLIGTLIALAG